MPGDGKNPKIVERIVNLYKALEAPAKNPNRAIFWPSAAIASASGFTGFIAIISPITIHPSPVTMLAVGVTFIVSGILFFKHL